jgi:hypothetical protein
VLVAAVALLLSPTASAHDRKSVGGVQLTIGWLDEPPLTGFENAVEVEVSSPRGGPTPQVVKLSAVEVSFGDARTTLPLVPGESPGEFLATIVPTRAGVYAFRVLGSVGGRRIDVTSTCSERTFECVEDAAEHQFPTQDPSSGQLAERLARGLPRAESARSTASDARSLAVVAIGLSALALAVAAGTAVVSRRRGRR